MADRNEEKNGEHPKGDNSKNEAEASASESTGKASAESDKGPDAIAMLKADHRTVEELFEKYEKARKSDKKSELVKQICDELIIHTKLEEELFYAACREHVDDDMLDEAQVEHDGAKTLIRELMQGSPDEQFFDAKVSVLSEYIKHHVQEEEKRSEGIFASARAAGLDMNALAAEMRELKELLKAQAEGRGLRPPKARSFLRQKEQFSTRAEETSMARGRMPERDEQGRFTSDDDDGRGSRGSYRSSQYRDDDYDDRRSSRSSRSSRYDDDDYDDRRSSRGGRNQGGWFGDPEGHSEASRRGWESRESSSRGGGRYGDDDNGYSSRSRSSRSRYDDDDYDDRRSSRGGRGQGGWFGDSEGHSEAARMGWENRSSSRSSRYDDDDDGYSSRSRSSRSRYDDDYDDRRSSSSSRGGRGQGRSQGGWFGDPEGHAEAARRGWRNR